MSKSLLGTAATLAKKKAELAALNNVTLPRIYQQIGKRIAGLAKVPPNLATHVERIRQLQAAMAASAVEAGTGSDGGFAAKAKQLAQKAAKATSDAAATVQLNSALATLGREAVLKYGEKAVPKELAAQLATLTAKQQELNDEIVSLEASHTGGIVTPRRLVVAGTVCGVLLGGVVLMRTVGSLFGGGGRPAGQPTFMPDLPDLGDIAPRSGRPKSESKPRAKPESTIADDLATIVKTIDDQRDSIRRNSEAATRDALDEIVRAWELTVADYTKPLADDSKVASLRYEMPEEARKAFDARVDEQNRELNTLRVRCEGVVQAENTELRRRVGEDASADDRPGNDFRDKLRSVCDKEKEKLAKARSQAIRTLYDLATSTKEKQERLARELQAEYDTAVASWSETVLALPGVSADETVQKLTRPKDVVNWNSRISNTQDQLTFKLKYLIDQKKAKSAEWAKDTASRFTFVDDIELFRAQAKKSLAAFMDMALEEARELRSTKVAELASLHAEAMREQSAVEASEAEAKAIRGRSYEAPADLTDAELAEIIKEAPDITDLGLVRAINLTDACMPAIASLKNLRALYFSNRRFHVTENENITAKGLSLLKGKQLKELTVPDRIFQDDEGFLTYAHIVADIRTCEVYWHAADVLRLDNARVSENVLEGLLDVPNILGLTLPSRVSDRGLETLQHFPHLQRVDFYLTDKVTDAGIRSLAKCKNLRMIIMWLPAGVVDVHISPEAIQALSGMNLAWFVVPRAMHVEKFFEPVLNTLSSDEVRMLDGQRLELMRREVHLEDPAEAFDRKRAANNPDRQQHEVFSMWHWPCTPTVLKACEGKAGIKELQIARCSVQEDALMSIGRIPDLTKLEIIKTEMNGRGLKTLSGAKQLKTVYITMCPQFGPEGVAALAQCAAIEVVMLVDVPLLRDADLLKFANCKELKRLGVKGSGASKSLLVKLQNLMPECEIDINP